MPEYTAEIAALDNTVLSDITSIAQDLLVEPMLNRADGSSFKVPLSGKVRSVSVASLLEADAGDGYPTLCTGNRRLIIKKSGTCISNTTLWTCERQGGPNDAYAEVTGWGPMIRWQTRWAQDADGSIVDGTVDDLSDPDFGKPVLDLPAGAVDDDALTVSGGDLLQQMIDNTIANDGPMGISTAGTFNTTVPPALDVSFALTDWPTRIADIAALLFAAGAVDAMLAPTAAAGEPQAVLSGLNAAGSDLSGSISFEWGTGLKNASHVRHVESMDDFANVIRFFLGPRVQPNRWKGSIDASTSGITTDPTTSQSVYGNYVDYPVFDSRGTENTVREIYKRIFNSELAYRMEPRQTLFLTPQAGLAPEPFDDYNLGDRVGAAVGAALGLTITGAVQKIFGFRLAIGQDGVGRVGELITTADA